MMLCEAIPSAAPALKNGAPWTDEDDAKLASLHMQQPEVPIEKISALLGRSTSSVISRLSRLRLRRIEGGKLRKCVRHEYCGSTIYSTWAGERLCYACRLRVREYA